MKSLIKKLIGSTFIYFLLFMIIGACRKPPVYQQPCNRTGTIVSVMCGVGAYNNLWIRPDGSDSLLKPCSVPANSIMPVAGQRVRFAYFRAPANQGCYDHVATCLAVVPAHQKVTITCIQLLPDENKCELKGTLRNYTGKYNDCGWMIEADNGKKIEPYGIPSDFRMRDGMRISFSYREVQTFKEPCMGGTGGQITCIREIAECTPIDKVSKLNDRSYASITKATIIDNCLKLEMGFSGCDNNTNRFRLQWDGKFIKTNPAVIELSLYDSMEVTCMAYFTAFKSFDLSEIKRNSPGALKIRLAGYATELNY